MHIEHSCLDKLFLHLWVAAQMMGFELLLLETVLVLLQQNQKLLVLDFSLPSLDQLE